MIDDSGPLDSTKKMGKFQKQDDKAVKADSSAAPAKESSVNKEVVNKSKSRDFSGDLGTYVLAWKGDRAVTGWKFNKILQNWALAECLNGDAISKDLFHVLLPYLVSVQGGARDRLLERCDKLTAAHDEQTDATTEVKRARKVVAKLRKAEGAADAEAGEKE